MMYPSRHLLALCVRRLKKISLRHSLSSSQMYNSQLNGPNANRQMGTANQVKRPVKPTAENNALLTTAPMGGNQQMKPVADATRKDGTATKTAEANEEDEDEDEDENGEEEEESEEDSEDGSSDRFSIKSDLAQVNEDVSRARRTPPLYIRPHLRAKFAFNQLLQVLPQSPSDTNQPATVEIVPVEVRLSAVNIHSIDEFSSLGFTLISTCISSGTRVNGEFHWPIDSVSSMLIFERSAHQ